jgi:hypothetical protein
VGDVVSRLVIYCLGVRVMCVTDIFSLKLTFMAPLSELEGSSCVNFSLKGEFFFLLRVGQLEQG